jgi:hypothetical protein
MKSILYVGATLMIGASIYGFVDYKKTKQAKEFTSMYEGEKKKEPVVLVDNKTTEPVVKKDQPVKERKVITKKQQASKEEDIPSIKPIGDEEAISVKETREIGKTEVNVTVPADNNIEKKVVKKKRKLSTKLFSRAPIREDEMELPDPVKPAVKKTENKEQ